MRRKKTLEELELSLKKLRKKYSSLRKAYVIICNKNEYNESYRKIYYDYYISAWDRVCHMDFVEQENKRVCDRNMELMKQIEKLREEKNDK